jgi:hypothetical protein
MIWPWTKDEVHEPSTTKEAINAAVYWELEKRLTHYSSSGVWISGNYDPQAWEPKFAKVEAEIARIRAWVTTLPKGVERDSYTSWLDYHYEWGIKDAREELLTQKQKRHMDEVNSNSRRVSEKMKSLTISKPPL